MSDTYIVETTAEVINPYKDGRSKDWNKLPTIPAGSRFIVGHSLYGAHGYAFEPIKSELTQRILAAAVKVEPQSVKELSEVHNCAWGGDEILRVLVKLGRVKPEDFAAVCAAVEANENF